MNPYLIERIHQMTLDAFQSFSKDFNNSKLINSWNKSEHVQCMSAAYFLQYQQPLFISIHDEAGNANKHYHDFFEINYVLEGNPIGIIDNHEIRFKKGNLIIMNPNAIHYYKHYKDEKDIILNIVLPTETFQKSIYLPLLSDQTLNAFFIRYKVENNKQSSFIFLEKPDISTENLIEMLVTEYIEKQSYNQVIIESLITLLFSYILRSYNIKREDIGHPVNDILDYIYKNYQTCTINTLADKFNYHPKYLSSLIHKHAGQSYRELVVNIKLQNALHYLLYSDYTIEEIVELIGYKEKSSFYNCFKKHFKSSPGAYRKKYVSS